MSFFAGMALLAGWLRDCRRVLFCFCLMLFQFAAWYLLLALLCWLYDTYLVSQGAAAAASVAAAAAAAGVTDVSAHC
jgi:triphosphoribosyl-dephospho-CoA synthetase